jgi:hypothetical protein
MEIRPFQKSVVYVPVVVAETVMAVVEVDVIRMVGFVGAATVVAVIERCDSARRPNDRDSGRIE